MGLVLLSVPAREKFLFDPLFCSRLNLAICYGTISMKIAASGLSFAEFTSSFSFSLLTNFEANMSIFARSEAAQSKLDFRYKAFLYSSEDGEVSDRLCVSGLLLYQGCQVTSMVSLKPLMQWSRRLRAHNHVRPLSAPVLVLLRAVDINSLPCAFLETASQGGCELVTQINVDWLVFVSRLK